MKPVDESQARQWANMGRTTHAQSVAAIRDLRGQTVWPAETKHPRVVLSRCKPLQRTTR
jgi:hypothetical protein